MMKTVSGLSGEHLRYDVGAFLRQLDDGPHGGADSESTHPSIFVRCRALLWFSVSEVFSRGGRHFNEEELHRLDKHVDRDIERFVDGPIRQILFDAEENLLLWVVAQHAVRDGVLDKREQNAISELVGEDTLNRLKEFLSNIPMSSASDEVDQRMKSARDDLEKLVPSSFEKTFRLIQGKVEKSLG
jgi:hypothetical protein